MVYLVFAKSFCGRRCRSGMTEASKDFGLGPAVGRTPCPGTQKTSSLTASDHLQIGTFATLLFLHMRSIGVIRCNRIG